MHTGDETATAADRRADATRERILTAAHECVREFGVRRTSMERVADRAGVSRAGLYRYFANKQLLVDAVLARNGNLVRIALSRQLEGVPNLADKVAVAARFGRFPPPQLLLLRLNDTEPEALALLLTTGARPFLERATRFWEPHVASAVERGEVAPELDVSEAAEWVARSLFALSTTPPIALTGADPDAYGDHARRFIVAGMVRSVAQHPPGAD
jgi:AcrR family transcriptional regulator